MVKISIKEAKERIVEIFMKAGMNEDEAAIMAQMLVEADQRGVNSHGILCTARYVRLIREGKMRPNMEKKVLRDNGVVAVWDGNRSSGQLLGYRGMEEAIAKAKKNGVGIVCIKTVPVIRYKINTYRLLHNSCTVIFFKECFPDYISSLCIAGIE